MQLGTLTLFAMAILLGYISGDIINHVPNQAQIFPLILGFGVAALLYLVTEELLVEAHSVEDTPFITAMFFVGFLIPLVVAHI